MFLAVQQLTLWPLIKDVFVQLKECKPFQTLISRTTHVGKDTVHSLISVASYMCINNNEAMKHEGATMMESDGVSGNICTAERSEPGKRKECLKDGHMEPQLSVF